MFHINLLKTIKNGEKSKHLSMASSWTRSTWNGGNVTWRSNSKNLYKKKNCRILSWVVIHLTLYSLHAYIFLIYYHVDWSSFFSLYFFKTSGEGTGKEHEANPDYYYKGPFFFSLSFLLTEQASFSLTQSFTQSDSHFY